MSIHSSFRTGGSAAKHRNVLTRLERLEKLEAAERWNQESGLFGLPKVRSIKVAMKKKKKKTEEEEAEKK